MDTQQSPREWACQSSGDCCRVPKAVVMTYAERRLLESVVHKALAPLRFAYNERPSMTQMVTGPCPFVTTDNRCAAYDVRPFSCRRFGCMRSDVATEPFVDEDAASIAKRRPETLPLLLRMQSDSQQWAVLHGWKED